MYVSLGLFETEKPLSLSRQERSLAIEEVFPIIWGATKQNADGMWKLGENITVAFTKSKKIETLKAWFNEHQLSITVLSFGDKVVQQLLKQSNSDHTS